MKEIKEMLSFDDVLLKPHYSECLPKEVSLKTNLTKNFEINLPIISAGMDTVTEIDMAYAMAMNGGVGSIHKNLTITQQANMISQIKKTINGVCKWITTCDANQTIGEIRNLILNEQKDDCIFVIENKKIKSLVTKGVLKNKNFSDNEKMGSIEMERALVSASVKSSPKDLLNIMKNNNIDYLPLFDENKKICAVSKKRFLKHFVNTEDLINLWNVSPKVFGAIGVTEDAMERALKLHEANVDGIIIDCAHGHSKKVLELTTKIKNTIPSVLLIVGNVVTKEGVRDLKNAGADVIKVGIGPGSICTTRIISGVGVPQFSAILETVEEADKLKIKIIADGGIRTSGDIVKALAAGACSVMIGSLVAGCDESPSSKVIFDNKTYKKYRGMGSISAMEAGSRDRYGQEGQKKLVPEGIEGLIPYKGPLKEILFQMSGGLRSGMGYLGARNLNELKENAIFVKQTNIGLKESHSHSVIITSEQINYSK